MLGPTENDLEVQLESEETGLRNFKIKDRLEKEQKPDGRTIERFRGLGSEGERIQIRTEKESGYPADVISIRAARIRGRVLWGWYPELYHHPVWSVRCQADL